MAPIMRRAHEYQAKLKLFNATGEVPYTKKQVKQKISSALMGNEKLELTVVTCLPKVSSIKKPGHLYFLLTHQAEWQLFYYNVKYKTAALTKVDIDAIPGLKDLLSNIKLETAGKYIKEPLIKHIEKFLIAYHFKQSHFAEIEKSVYENLSADINFKPSDVNKADNIPGKLYRALVRTFLLHKYDRPEQNNGDDLVGYISDDEPKAFDKKTAI